jgi:hypothetical protein
VAIAGNFRRGVFTVAGGFTITTRLFSVIVSWRPAPALWQRRREPDVNGYRGAQLGRLLILGTTGRQRRRPSAAAAGHD